MYPIGMLSVDRPRAETLYEAVLAQAPNVGSRSSIDACPAGQDLLASDADLQAQIVRLACADLQARWMASVTDPALQHRDRTAFALVEAILALRPSFPPDAMAAILDTCAVPAFWNFSPLRDLVRLASKRPTPVEAAALRQLRDVLAPVQAGSSRTLVARIDRLLEAESGTPIAAGPWSERVLADIESGPDPRRTDWRALAWLARSAPATEPSNAWRRQVGERLAGLDRMEVRDRIVGWLQAAPAIPRPGARRYSGQPTERDAEYLAGFVWILGTLGDPATSSPIADLADRCLKKVHGRGAAAALAGHACVRVLASLPGTASVAQLVRLRQRVKYAASRRVIEQAVARAAARTGLAPERLEEVAVPTFGLDATGALHRDVGGYVATLRLSGATTVSLSWRSSEGRSLKTVPAPVRREHPGVLEELRALAKAMEELLVGQRARLEQLLVSERAVRLDEWQRAYVDHPLIGTMARRLIWRFSDGRTTALGAIRERGIVGPDDQPLLWTTPATDVQAWHPLGTSPDVVAAWRGWLDRHGITQPFRQAHREVYEVTDAERAAVHASSRFAGHVLLQRPLAALCRERGWRHQAMGGWDVDHTPRLRMPRWNLEVELLLRRPVDFDEAIGDNGTYDYVLADQVRFLRDGSPLGLDDVPGLAFSEAMRDVDLFVGVSSLGVGVLPEPRMNVAPGEPDPLTRHWESSAFGALSDMARSRRAVLEALIPRLTAADRMSLDDRHVVVRGRLWTYRIHIGSANVLMEPGSRYLCILPDRLRPVDVWLPFDGDRQLSVVLSKAMLLLNDTRITDPVIVRQLRRPRVS